MHAGVNSTARPGGAWLMCALAAAVLCLGGPAGAQPGYQAGQAIQYSDGGGGWTDAQFLRLTPDGSQAIIVEENAYFPGGSQRAVALSRLRAKPARGAAPPTAPGETGRAATGPGAPSRLPGRAPAGAHAVGDAVQYYAPGWYDAVVVAIGSGANAGQYKVQDDRYGSEVWASASSVRARPAAPDPGAAAAGPRAGDYNIYSYGNPRNPLRLGHINLTGKGSYRFYDNGGIARGEGQYSFAGAAVIWRTGLLKQYGWTGAFQVARGGRDHVIRLNRVTVATNSR